MKSYWDIPEQDRAKLTEDEVRSLCKVELMQKGVKDPDKCEPIEIPPLPSMRQTAYYKVADIVFAKLEDAQAFINLHPLKETYEWNLGYKAKFPAEVESSIETVMLYSRDEVLSNRQLLSEIREKSDAKDRRESEYRDAFAKAREATKGIWDDWYAQQETAKLYEKVRTTFSEYKEMTEGNEELALEFLRKVYEDEIVDKALGL